MAAWTLAFLAASGASASPADMQAGGEHAGRPHFVDTATVPREELRELPDPVPLSTYLHTGKDKVAASPSERHGIAGEGDLRAECAKHEAQAKSKKGWIKSRFESCFKRHYDLFLRNRANTEAIGRLIFDAWVLGFAYDGKRRVDFAVSVENIYVAADSGQNARTWRIAQEFSHAIDTGESDPGAAVTEPTVKRRDDLLGEWNSTPHWNLVYTSPDNGPQHRTGNLQRVQTIIDMDTAVTSPSVDPYVEVASHQNLVRFDYAGPIVGKHKGTVFTQARVELVMSKKNPEVNESALHIYDAQERPERTFPSFVGKTVPGENDPLHRVTDPNKIEDQRRHSIKECNKVWGDYTGTRLQCDEYPFASTREGSLKGDNRFSVRLIEGTDNHNGGKAIQATYDANRILNGDPFYVKITS
ncbi:NucA/NucB deoxyribonuclease domain-containing protein [Streptomyces sp. NEAU-Y11]|uniref:NucA/NucB deoxyribonuclease domain-containing protein n=1 Tax=Streptomyces cucumeris TaxID=2962890 RepID=UPI0020C86B74|nr:NucA/NucB deoxyribonuclease domain-containing protein [Streptomyces sp. NEAU-Y11]MCP9211607.1 NucA/NucB deoxyribonuclease domain-containing protein [Streptomyces sp. NEAU-Y11]